MKFTYYFVFFCKIQNDINIWNIYLYFFGINDKVVSDYAKDKKLFILISFHKNI